MLTFPLFLFIMFTITTLLIHVHVSSSVVSR